MYTVVQRRSVGADPDRTWRMLAEPTLVSEWFADVECLRPGESFRFDFGDGDFFAGTVVAWDRPRSMRLTWRFMGVGPRFEIEYAIEPNAAGSEVIVTDLGAPTVEESEILREGWSDFLGRLDARIRSGQPARYRWSPTFGAAAILGADIARVRSRLGDPLWWKEAFPFADAQGGNLAAVFMDPAWSGLSTRAAIALEPLGDDGTYVRVVHEGWDALPEERQVGERRRYAGLWAGVLRAWEAQYPWATCQPGTSSATVEVIEQ